METPAESCQNYQLKWSSYTSYIHSCISSSLSSEDSFADVALVTMDGHKIMAHRFVLSYSSQYLNKALKFQPKVTTTLPIMIVLPEDITYKALKVLVKYMYSGAATVPKDILNSVLKAGDMLKIKGLHRDLIAEENNSNNKPGRIVNSPNSSGQIIATQDAINKTIQKAPKAQEVSPLLNKNPPPLVAVSQKIIQTYPHSKSKNLEKPQEPLKSQNKAHAKVAVSSSSVKQHGAIRVLNYTIKSNNNSKGMEKENTPPKRAILGNQKVSEQDKSHTITSVDVEFQKSSDTPTLTINENNRISTDNVSYLVIKDENLEWAESEIDIVEHSEGFAEESVKSETYDSGSNDDKGSTSEMYTPLTCEFCSESFTIPADWVKHIQTHTDRLPAKRKWRDSPYEDDENASYQELQCDLCDKSFTTPAEWVRHTQNSHTDFELSLSNRKIQKRSK